jgi:hypothetical protein
MATALATRQILAKPFPFASHKWRVLNTTKDKNKATWYVYIDARDVAQRLDATGLDWSDDYQVIEMSDKICIVQCRLTIGNSTRMDVGSDAKQSSDADGNYVKGAFSDALKRAAVKFGIGRYLYSMTSFYVPIDEYKKFTPEALTKIKAHLSKELAKAGAEGSAEDLRNDDEEAPEPTLQELATKPAEPPAANGHKKDDGIAGWAANPNAVLFDINYQFTNPASAQGWGMAMGVFNDGKHAENAYNEVKAATKPKSAAEMWQAWINDVARRVNEKKPVPA